MARKRLRELPKLEISEKLKNAFSIL